MKIVLISPNFPPVACGVGDHGACIADALQKLGHEVRVITSAQSVRNHPLIPVSVVSKPWGTHGFTETLENLAAAPPDLVLFQFTPFLYKSSRWDLALDVPRFLRRVRELCGPKIGVIAHELRYPLEFSRSGIRHGITQWIQFERIFQLADHVFFTNEISHHEFQKKAPQKASWIPVGSNLLGLSTSPWTTHEGDFPASHPLWGKRHRLIHFGGAHPTHLLGHVYEALAQARCRHGANEVALGLLGIRPDQLPSPLPDGAFALGYLSVDAANECLKASSLVLAPFMDGISTRRGSVMAALALGRPVVSCLGRYSDPSVDWARICVIVNSADARVYGDTVASLLSDEARGRAVGESGQREFETRFSWEAVARGMMSPWGLGTR